MHIHIQYTIYLPDQDIVNTALSTFQARFYEPYSIVLQINLVLVHMRRHEQ